MRILAIDIGKNKSVACDYDTVATANQGFETIRTTPQEVHDLIVKRGPDRVVIEICGVSGWFVDLCKGLGIEIQVANPTHDAWRWKNVKTKTDRTDALKLAQLSAANQLPTVYIPALPIRQWRALIAHRHRLIRERTRAKNAIRALIDQQGLSASMGDGKKAWGTRAVDSLDKMSRNLADLDMNELWRGQLKLQLLRMDQLNDLINQVTVKLDAIGEKNDKVQLLRSMPGIGPRLAEIVVATIDDPKRFKSAKHVGSYAGLAPRQYQSGAMDRKGHISCQGNPLLRALLVEVTWASQMHNPWLKALCQRYQRGSKGRAKIGIVATARRLLVICWAMLRDGTRWKAPAPAASPA